MTDSTGEDDASKAAVLESATATSSASVVQRLNVASYVFVGVLALLIVARLARAPADALGVVELLVVIALAVTLAAEFVLAQRVARRESARDAGMTRILQGMSRSASSDAIVQTIVDELRAAADADHILVARLRPVDRVVEATMVSSRARAPASRTVLPQSVLDPEKLPSQARRSALDGARDPRPEQLVADEIARRLSDAYGLAHTTALPLVANGEILGALVLSRRQPRAWTRADRRLLWWAASEMSAALARAFAFEQAENQANIDALTGLPNRRYLEELLSTVGPRRRAIDRLGALMIDLDHFKALNDRYGHATGDRVLRAVGERISNAVRADDTPARYGGEEFAVILRRATPEQAFDVAERIRSDIESIAPRDLGISEKITVSIGVAVGDVRAGEVPILLAAADDALYAAKRQGRNRVVLAA
jgi:diguanylate cyclase (GGDEF)-like protein